MSTALFLEDLKSYARQAVLVRRAAASTPADRALAEALREHIGRFRPRPRPAGAVRRASVFGKAKPVKTKPTTKKAT